MFLAYAGNFVHICHMAIEMNHHDGFGSVRNLFFYFIRINLVIGVRLYKDRGSAVDGDSHDAGDISIALNEDFVAGADTQQPHGNPEGVQSAGQSHTVAGACVGSKTFLKGLYFLSQYVPA